MTTENPAPPSINWPALSAIERRLLGVLVEKAKTTPDAYPLSLNALVTGSNQKSNREPVMNLDDATVEDALAGLQKRVWVQKVVGGRVERWRHVLYEVWHVNKVELAILAELLLRGPQTEGELRGRASRMEPIDDLEALRALLRSLAERKLVVYLSPEGRRGTTVTHGFHAAEELERLHATAGVEAAAPAREVTRETDAGATDRLADLDARVAALASENESLRATVNDLQTQVAQLTEQVRALKDSLGG
jgi:uncharacterized protein YceH (UPF0502 family)